MRGLAEGLAHNQHSVMGVEKGGGSVCQLRLWSQMDKRPAPSWPFIPPVGSDIWTPMEKRLFKKAFCAHKKDFYLIHKTVRWMWVDWGR